MFESLFDKWFKREWSHKVTPQYNIDEQETTSNVIVYADDNTPSSPHEDPLILKEMIETDAKTISDWFHLNEMITSGDKTKLLIIGTNSNRSQKLDHNNMNIEISVCDENVKESTGEKLLGVIVNNTLTWKNHLFVE